MDEGDQPATGRMNPLPDLLFSHWLNRMCEIQAENGGMWQGNRHPSPIILHKLIDDRLDELRPLRDPHLPLFPVRYEAYL